MKIDRVRTVSPGTNESKKKEDNIEKKAKRSSEEKMKARELELKQHLYQQTTPKRDRELKRVENMPLLPLEKILQILLLHPS